MVKRSIWIFNLFVVIWMVCNCNNYALAEALGDRNSGIQETVNPESSFGKAMYECGLGVEQSYDLTSYLGETVSIQFPDMISGVTMSGYHFQNDEVYFCSTRADEAITTISVSSRKNVYKILGIRTDMNMEEAHEILMEMGFEKTKKEGLYRDDQGYYVSLQWGEDGVGLEISLSALGFSEAGNRTELSHYYDASFETVHNAFPELSLSVVDGTAILEDGFVCFKGQYEQGKDVYMESVIVNTIIITGAEAPYCIYGLYPGIDISLYGNSGLSEGGSGERMDLMGNVVYLYGEDEEGNPQIHMYTPG